MSRERAKRILPLINLAEKAAKDAMIYMGKLQQLIVEENHKKDSLLEYQSEYQQSFSVKGQQGISGADIQQFESFILQIQAALKHQQVQVSQMEVRLDKAKKVYIQLNQRLESYKKLQNRLTDQAIATENRQLQKLLDELSIQLHRSKSE